MGVGMFLPSQLSLSSGELTSYKPKCFTSTEIIWIWKLNKLSKLNTDYSNNWHHKFSKSEFLSLILKQKISGLWYWLNNVGRPFSCLSSCLGVFSWVYSNGNPECYNKPFGIWMFHGAAHHRSCLVRHLHCRPPLQKCRGVYPAASAGQSLLVTVSRNVLYCH